MQDQYSLLHREEEREMFGLLADQGVGSHPVEPAGRRPGRAAVGRAGHAPASQSNPTVDLLGRPLFLDSDKAIVDAVQTIAQAARRVDGTGRDGVGAASNPVVDAPIVGATKPHHLTDAVAALDLKLTDDEIAALEEPYTPRQPTYF